MKWKQTVNALNLEFEISVETNAPVHVEIEVESLVEFPSTGLIHIHVRGDSRQIFYIQNCTISWALPTIDMHGLYFGGNPMAELAYLPFWQRQKSTSANSGIPYLSLVHRCGENRAAFGFIDQIIETALSAELSEITRCYHIRFQKPANGKLLEQGIRVSEHHHEAFFVSLAHVPWPDVLKLYAQSVSERSYLPAMMPVPDHAFDPVFCTWTAIHHKVSHEWIMRNAPIAADLGFSTWITDDGWFIEDGRFGDYRYAGDWQPNSTKFPDFRANVNAVQALGFRYVLWVAPFMVGKASRAAKQYAHLLTMGQEREQFDNLAPWHAETGTIVTELLSKLVDDYDLDGLKIDFLDSVRVRVHETNSNSDQTLGQGIYTILQQAVDHILLTKPDLLVEFRNSYANLASRRFANVYRSSDVPINFTLNRWQAVMLRLLAPDRAVHLDPALWHPQDTDENVAVHLINCLVSVPMVSIELDQYPPSHLALIRYWIGFYNEHRNTIIHGEFQPVLRLGHIPIIYFFGSSDTIIGLYEDVDVSTDLAARTTWLLNASTRDYVDFSNRDCQGTYLVVTRDKFGQIISTERVAFPRSRLEVEVGGSLEIRTQ